MSENLGKVLSFGEHFRELRSRLISIITIFSILFIICWIFRNDLLNLYLKLLSVNLLENKGEIIILKIVDKFHSHLLTAAFFSILLVIPFVMSILGGFISPALQKKEKRYITLILTAVTLLFYCGVLLSYFFIIPFAYKYFISYSLDNEGIISDAVINNDLRLSLKDIVSITQKFMLVFGTISQTPLIILLVNRIGLVKLSGLKRYRRHLYILCFALAAFLTPPDPITMISMALPLIILFEFGLILCKIFNKNG